MQLSADEARRELLAIARLSALRFPLETKADFVEQFVQAADDVRFAGVQYDAELCAGLIPAFFFPVDDLDDLLNKTIELLTSRGLVGGVDPRAGTFAP